VSASKRTGQAGQAIVELALVLPILAVLLFGAIEGGRLFLTYVALEEAVHEGATFGAQEFDTTQISARVTQSSSQQEVQNANVFRMDCTDATVTVGASTTFPAITPIGSLFAGLFSSGSFTTSATVVATNLQGACT
jgi:Flp pilus assembly protein TadG